MPRTLPTTLWNRERFLFNVADTSWTLVCDTSGVEVLGQSNDQVLTTSWT